MRGTSTARARALAAAGAVALLCSGCFVLDELEEGQKRMEQDSPARSSSESPEPEAPGGARTGPGFLERAQSAIGRVPGALRDLAGMGASGSGGGQQPRDPAEHMVRCEVDGSLIFTRRIDCEARGGRISGEIRALSP